MKLLFICSHDFDKVHGGGSQCTNRNYDSLCEILGPDNVKVMQLFPKLKMSFSAVIKRIISYSYGYDAGLSIKEINNIISISKNYDFIFIDSSKYGVLAYLLKKENYQGKIICFFHNVEYKLFLQRIKLKPHLFWKKMIIYKNEKNAVHFSDRISVLNNRDLKDLGDIYTKFEKKKAYVLPISFKDKFPPFIVHNNEEKTASPPTCLFVGDAWFANIHGINWFIANVLDHVNLKLQIAGKASDALKKEITHQKIEFLGYVPDLTTVIMNADFILAPIFKGGGMKVKICESLMYGKNIIGTSEAFEGYDLDYNKTGTLCNNKHEFIEILNKYSESRITKFNTYNRNCFLKKYSYQSTLEIFKNLLANKTDILEPIIP